MAETFIISDSHFGHANSLTFKQSDGSPLRDFSSVEEMDEHMVQCWNSVVRPEDKVIHLGDVVINKKYLEILRRLNGKKKLIMGNHDIFDMKYYTEHFYEMKAYRVFDKHIMSHIPVHKSSIGRFAANVHGHCVDQMTEILTVDGWKSYTDIKVGDRLPTVCNHTGLWEEDIVKNVFVYDDYAGDMYHMKAKGLDMMVTPNHRVASKSHRKTTNTSNSVQYEEAVKAFSSYYLNVIKSANPKTKTKLELSDDMIRLYIWLAADGSLTPAALCRISLEKDRKIKSVLSLLERMQIEYKVFKPHTERESKNRTTIHFKLPKELESFNVKGLDEKLLLCDENQADIIRETYRETDGNRNLIFSSKEKEIDLLQRLFVLNGRQSKKHSRIAHGFSKGESYQLSTTNNQTQLLTKVKDRVKVVQYNGAVWCVETTNGNFFARRNGSVFVTGNSHSEKVLLEDGTVDPHYISMCVEQKHVNYTPVPWYRVKEILKARGIYD